MSKTSQAPLNHCSISDSKRTANENLQNLSQVREVLLLEICSKGSCQLKKWLQVENCSSTQIITENGHYIGLREDNLKYKWVTFSVIRIQLDCDSDLGTRVAWVSICK